MGMFVLIPTLYTVAVDDLTGGVGTPPDLVEPLELDGVGAEDEAGRDLSRICQ
jgi:hypothetical protein